MGSGRAAQLVAVGVDGSEAASEAARYAAEVADQRGWDLMLVHSYHDEAGREAAESVADHVISVLELGGRTRVHRMVTRSSAVDALRQVSRYVSLLVLGRRRVDPDDPLLDGQVGAAVAAGAHCPVVVVPSGWSPNSSSGGPVVVALDGDTPSEAALRIAFEEAELYGTGVLALLGSPGREDQLPADAGGSLGFLLARVEQDHPGVQVRTITVDGAVRTDILGAPVAAAQVVVGRLRPDRENASWSRLVASAVAAESACPVVIAPPEDSAGQAGTGGAAAAYLGRGAPRQTPPLLEVARVAGPDGLRPIDASDPLLPPERSGRRPSWWPIGRRRGGLRR